MRRRDARVTEVESARRTRAFTWRVWGEVVWVGSGVESDAFVGSAAGVEG